MEQLQLINTALLKNEIIPDILAYGSEIFTDAKLKQSYALIKDIYTQDKPVDLPVLISEAKKTDVFDKIGGNDFISQVSACMPVLNHTAILENLDHMDDNTYLQNFHHPHKILINNQ